MEEMIEKIKKESEAYEGGWKEIAEKAKTDADLAERLNRLFASSIIKKDLLFLKECADRIDTNIRDKDGSTPLHYAAIVDSDETVLKMIDYLLAHGADVNALDNKGKNPYYYALLMKQTKTADFLKEHGAEISDEDLTMIKERDI